MITTTIQKWGNSYAVRLPKTTLRKFNLRAGHSVEIREMAHSRTLSIIPVKEHALSLKEMVARITEKNRHEVADWGNAVGKEVW